MPFRPLTSTDERQGIKGGPLVNFGVGVGTQIGKSGLGAGQALLKLSGKIAKGFGLNEDQYDPYINKLEELKQGIYGKPVEKNTSTLSGKAGKLTADIATFAGSTPAITKAQAILRGGSSSLLKNAPGLLRGAAKFGARAVPEGLASGAIQYAISGGDEKSAKNVGLFSGITSGVLGAAGDLYRNTYAPGAEQSALKAFGTTGKMSAGKQLNQGRDYLEGLQVIKERSPGITVTDIDGIEKPFDPSKATYSETLQAWDKVRGKIYDEYNNLAQQTTDEGLKVDLDDIFENMIRLSKDKRATSYKNAARTIAKELADNFGVYDDAGELIGLQASPLDLETYLKDLNKQAATVLTTGTSDKALGEISASTGKMLRGKMDDLISNATGEEYQALRDQYGALKNLESGLVNQFKKQARRIGGGLSDYVQIFGSGDLINGLFSGNPSWAAAGLTKNIAAQVRRNLINPERYLRRAFELLDEPTKEAGTRFGGGEAGTKAFMKGEQFVDDLKNTKGKQGGYLNLGDDMLEKKTLTDAEESLIKEAKKYKTADEFVKAQLDKNSFIAKNPIKVYRGEGKGIGNETLVSGRYFADSEEFAKNFGDVTTYEIPKGAKIFDLDKIKFGNNQIVSDTSLVDPQKLTDFLMDNGFEYTKNTNSRGVEYVKLRRYAESESNRNAVNIFNRLNKNFGDLVGKYKTKESFANNAIKRAEINPEKYGSPAYKILTEFFRDVKSGNIPKINKSNSESQLTDIWNKVNKKGFVDNLRSFAEKETETTQKLQGIDFHDPERAKIIDASDEAFSSIKKSFKKYLQENSIKFGTKKRFSPEKIQEYINKGFSKNEIFYGPINHEYAVESLIRNLSKGDLTDAGFEKKINILKKYSGKLDASHLADKIEALNKNLIDRKESAPDMKTFIKNYFAGKYDRDLHGPFTALPGEGYDKLNKLFWDPKLGGIYNFGDDEVKSISEVLLDNYDQVDKLMKAGKEAEIRKFILDDVGNIFSGNLDSLLKKSKFKTEEELVDSLIRSGLKNHLDKLLKEIKK